MKLLNPSVAAPRRTSGVWLAVILPTVALLGGAVELEARRVPAVAALSVTAVQGSSVTLSWQPPADTVPPDLYVIEGGVLPGQALASLPVAGTDSSVTLTLLPGTYYARLYEVRGNTRLGPSSEVLIGMGVDLPPAAPREVAVRVVGHDVAITWRPSFDGGVATDMLLDVSGPISGALPLSPSGEAAFADVPPGHYTVTLRSRNAAGMSDAVDPIALVVPGPLPVADVLPLAAPDAPRLLVRHERFTTPRLAQFVEREQLAAVVQPAASEFEAILRLKDWVAAQFAMSNPSPYPPWDAMTVLDWIRAGVTGGFCGQYSQVFVQALHAFGVPARYLEIGVAANPYNHFTSEVWSNDFDKWVLLDVAFNNYFARDGVPLSAVEIRDALLTGRLDDVEVVLGSVRDGHPSPLDWPQRTAELFYYMRYHLNANHVTAPDEPPFERSDMVEWLDGRTVPWELSTVPSEFPHERITIYETADRGLVDWAPNQVWITPRRIGVFEYALDLQHSILQPSHVESRVTDAAGVPGPWTPQPLGAVVWRVAPGDRLVEVRGVNVMGRRGPISSVRLDVP